MNKIVFLDMDNTLALFQAKGESLPDYKKEGFFLNLPPIQENLSEVIDNLTRKAKIYILSASPHEQADREKREWVNKYLNLPQEQILICRIGQNKAQFLREKGIEVNQDTILVDDYKQNLADWVNAGGMALKKRYSNKQGPFPVVRDLEEIERFL
jgi:5'(3')-deoxyribonucleotidase